MAIIANLAVALTARTDKFKRGMRNSRKEVSMFSRGIRAMGLSTAVAAAAITGAITQSVREFVTYADTIAKTSRRTGIAVRELSELAHAAQISGTSLAAVEKATRRMASSIVDANDGLAESVRAFDELGLKAADLIKLSPAEAFKIIGGELRDMEGAIKQAAAAQDIFGRSGTALLPLLRTSAEDMERLRRHTRQLGISLSPELATKAEDAADAWTTFRAAFPGIGGELMNTFTGQVRTLSDHIARMTQVMRGMIRMLPILNTIRTGQVVLLPGLIGDLLKTLDTTVDAVKTGAADGEAGMRALAGAAEETDEAFASVAMSAQQMASAVRLSTTTMSGGISGSFDFAQWAKRLADPQAEFARLGERADALQKTILGTTAAMQEQLGLTGKIGENMRERLAFQHAMLEAVLNSRMAIEDVWGGILNMGGDGGPRLTGAIRSDSAAAASFRAQQSVSRRGPEAETAKNTARMADALDDVPVLVAQLVAGKTTVFVHELNA